MDWNEVADRLELVFALEAREEELLEQPWKEELLPKLNGLALIPVGRDKRPVNPENGRWLTGWNGLSYSPQEIFAMNGYVTSVGFRPGPNSGHIACIDLDGASALEWIKEFGASVEDAGWRVGRDSDANRLKVYFRIPEKFRALLSDGSGKPIGKRVVTVKSKELQLDSKQQQVRGVDGKLVVKMPGEQIELFYGTGQTVVAGLHPSGDVYRSVGYPELVEAPNDAWMAVIAWIITAGNAETRSTADLSEAEKYQSGPQTPCPVCGRDKSGACTVFVDGERDRVNCHQGQTFAPPKTRDLGPFGGKVQLKIGDTITGVDGQEWAFAGEFINPSIGTFSKFVEDRPMPVVVEAPATKGGKKEQRLATFTELLNQCLDAIVSGDLDQEMEAKAELIGRMKRSDEQVHAQLFKLYQERMTNRTEKTDDSVDLSDVEQLKYRMDGWIPRGNTCLTFGSSVAGKTTLEAWKVWHFIQGRNILDREADPTPGKALFIATDSGAAALKKTFFDLGIDLENHPLVKKGPNRRLWIWAHAPGQGQNAWICDLRGVIELAEFVKENSIDLVVIDSAKSVAAAAGWSYSDNNAVRAMLKCMREVVCEPTGCCVDFINHDGKENGAHAGAKSWKEDVRMAMRLEEAKDHDGNRVGTKITFTKDGAAHVDPHRAFVYGLGEDGLTVGAEVETIGTAQEVILDLLWESHRESESFMTTGNLITAAALKNGASRKTVQNTLGHLKSTRLITTPGRGRWQLAPNEVERRGRRENQAFSYNRGVSEGGLSTKSIGTTTLSLCPDQCPDPFLGTNENESPCDAANVPTIPSGQRPGQRQIPDTAREEIESPPSTPTYLLGKVGEKVDLDGKEESDLMKELRNALAAEPESDLDIDYS